MRRVVSTRDTSIRQRSRHAGDSLFVAAGTIHSHWNPSTTDHLRFLEFIVAEKDKGRSIPQPLKK
jgi:quercetin dioxygenase-like cupin family protein